ncbi:hypothetical protein [Sphingomonas sp.]|jgi:hypothetical protein|uniref:hypothetical protein n=1 Tax=Sphingomonas sp. TaxID=28214 RepID=UPI002D7EBFF6|nr:hypothetical protein [Sphingomonas sp.]HEU0043642.1 hypothetical protein [Sphingomonas sp.]
MRNIVRASLVAAALFSTTPALAKKKAQLTPMEIQALQSHEYETSKEVLFASVVSVFQDLGYQLENADMPSGFITASSATKNKTGLLEAFAGMRSSGNTRATAFVEGMPSGRARVRLNFLNSKSTSSNYGQNSKDDKPILDPLTYKSAWDKIDEAIFVRAASNAPARPGTPPAATVSPASISVPVTAGTSVTVTPDKPK